MALSKEQTQAYVENLKEFKNYIEELKKEANLYKVQLKKSSKTLEPYYQLALVLISVRLINTCVEINKISMFNRKLRAEDYLNIGRKEIYSVFSAMEKIVGADYENGLDENRELLDKITDLNPTQRLNFLKGFKAAIDGIVDGYGSNTKWRWSWPELRFKYSVLAKNLLDFRAYERENDLENPYYYVRKDHFNLIVESANSTAQEYRTKFDLSTSDSADLKKSIDMLEMNRKIFQLTGNSEDLEKTKTLIESFSAKVEAIEAEKAGAKKKKK